MFVSSCLHSFPAETLCIPMILSSFSHFSFLHMAANMYVLWSFSTSAISMFGREQFMAIYLSAGINLVSVSNWLPVPFTNSTVSSGVISSFVSYTCKIATGRFGPSLGAVSATLPCHHLGLWRLLQMCNLIGYFFFSVWSDHGHPGCSLHQNARGQTFHHLPPYVHLHRLQCKKLHLLLTFQTVNPPQKLIFSIPLPLCLFLSLLSSSPSLHIFLVFVYLPFTLSLCLFFPFPSLSIGTEGHRCHGCSGCDVGLEIF